MPAPTYMYAGYPTAPAFKTKGGETNIRELLWGDWVKLPGDWEGDWVPVTVRSTQGWMKVREVLPLYDAQVNELAKRNVTVYGAINLRSDGKNTVIAYRLEERRVTPSMLTEWDVYCLKSDAGGQLNYAK